MKKPSLSTHLFASFIVLFLLFAGGFLLFQERREKQFKIALLNQQLQDYNTNLGEELQNGPLTEEHLEQFISMHPVPSLRVTVLDTRGYILFDNMTKEYPGLSDHSGRKEIQEALTLGSGYDIDRVSQTLDQEYFYSATRIPGQELIVRTALPYDDALPAKLRADYSFLGYAAILVLVLSVLLYWLSRRTGSSIRQQQDKDSAALQKELTQNISHELKTPVAALKAYMETMEKEPQMQEEVRTKFIGRSLALTQRLASLVEDLSSLDALEALKRPAFEDQVDIADIIRNVADEYAEMLAAKGFKLELNIPDCIPFKGHSDLIYGIFKNLTDNALKYAPDGSVVSIAAQENARSWGFIFADNGPGVPEESLPRLFDRFYRVDKGRSRELGGTGLGLSIVKEAVLLHGGDIKASVVKPHGLRYEFFLKKGL